MTAQLLILCMLQLLLCWREVRAAVDTSLVPAMQRDLDLLLAMTVPNTTAFCDRWVRRIASAAIKAETEGGCLFAGYGSDC
jgi:hypothetical protein